MLFCIITGNLENQVQDIKLIFTFSITFYIITLVMENKKKFIPNPDLKLLEQVRETLLSLCNDPRKRPIANGLRFRLP